MTKRAAVSAWTLGLALGLMAGAPAQAQTPTKKELVQRILKAQQPELEMVSRGIVERPAAQMMQEAGMAIQRQVAADKRESTAKSIETEVKKYVEEAYPLVRERAIRLAPSTIGTVLEEKMSEDELKQLVTWLESGANKKYQQLGPEMRNSFIQKVLTDARPVVDPKVQALDARVRVILGLPAATAAPASAGTSSGSAPAATKAPSK